MDSKYSSIKVPCGVPAKGEPHLVLFLSPSFMVKIQALLVSYKKETTGKHSEFYLEVFRGLDSQYQRDLTCQAFTTLKPHTFKPLILPKPSSSLVTFIVLEHDSLGVSRHPDEEILHGSPMNMEVPEYDEYGVRQWRCSPLYHSYSTGS